MLTLFGLDPATYSASALHSPERSFRETNCYTDIWIELLHAAGCDPAMAMAYTLAVDFEGDQWTFFKPPPEDLEALFGIDVHEMQLYRPMLDHVAEQLRAGRTMIIEADSFYMPDTQATAYKHAHVKSSVVMESLDVLGERLRYFHNAGHYELSGEDFRGLFRLGREFSPDVLPPYAEIVRFDTGERLTGQALRHAAISSLDRQLRRLPKQNPWRKFASRLAQDFPALLAGSEAGYHAYAFATVRQCGAAFELAQSFLMGVDAPAEAVEAYGKQSAAAKMLLLKLARRKPFDPAAALEQAAADWDAGSALLRTWVSKQAAAQVQEGLAVR